MYLIKGNRGRKELVFNEGDWVWFYFRKDIFFIKRKFKFSSRGDGFF